MLERALRFNWSGLVNFKLKIVAQLLQSNGCLLVETVSNSASTCRLFLYFGRLSSTAYLNHEQQTRQLIGFVDWILNKWQ